MFYLLLVQLNMYYYRFLLNVSMFIFLTIASTHEEAERRTRLVEILQSREKQLHQLFNDRFVITFNNIYFLIVFCLDSLVVSRVLSSFILPYNIFVLICNSFENLNFLFSYDR